MIRKLLIIGCLLCSVDISAQSKYELQYDEKNMPPEPVKWTGLTGYKNPGDSLPDIKIITLPWVEIFMENSADGKRAEKIRELTPMKTITRADLPADKNLIVMLFNPTCGHCEEQTELFQKNIGQLRNTQLLLVAVPAMGPYLNNFYQKFHLNEYPQIWMGLDYDNLVPKTFLYYSLPQLNVYDKDKKLLKIFSGGAPMDSLKQYIN